MPLQVDNVFNVITATTKGSTTKFLTRLGTRVSVRVVADVNNREKFQINPGMTLRITSKIDPHVDLQNLRLRL